MNNAWDVIAHTHAGGVYCSTCVEVQRERCSETWDDCPDGGAMLKTVVFASDEWHDEKLRALQILMCEECFRVLATYEAMNEQGMLDVQVSKSSVLDFMHGTFHTAYRWEGSTTLEVFEIDLDGNEVTLDALTWTKTPTLAAVEIAARNHFLNHLDSMGI